MKIHYSEVFSEERFQNTQHTTSILQGHTSQRRGSRTLSTQHPYCSEIFVRGEVP
jgi:hypothetical protein